MKFISEITVTPIQQMGGDSMVVAAAKVSTTGQEAMKLGRQACPRHTPFDPDYKTCDLCKPYKEQVQANYGLIKYLMKNRHGTPFEHSAMTFFVHAPIFVWREWHRHRHMSYNEESGRYKKLEPVFYIPRQDRPMMKVEDWKAGRPKFTVIDTAKFEDLKYYNLIDNLKESYTTAYESYEANLGLGFDPGLARVCLPVGIYSSCWVTTNPRALMHFLSLRTYNEQATYISYPLYEIEVAAKACEKIFAQGWPLCYKAFQECGRVGP